MPKNVVRDFGHGLSEAQFGRIPDIGKVLTGFGSADVMELKLDDRAGTFRVVYTVKFEDVVIVLHSFQKKSKKGKETTKQDKELIKSRLKIAKEMYEDWKNKGGKND